MNLRRTDPDRDMKLVAFSSWEQAGKFTPRDHIEQDGTTQRPL